MTGLKAELLEKAGGIPLLKHIARYAYERRFSGGSGFRRVFRGLYPDFASARASAPRGSTVGHDHASYVKGVTFARDRIYPSDYPVLFWLARLLKPGVRIFDWGGNVGISYYAYQRYLQYPEHLSWLVCDVPSVVTQGLQIKSTNAAPGLEFTAGVDALDTADILLIAGSLQFIEEPFAPLHGVRRLPTHVIVNKLPVYERPDAVTLLNNGTTFVPCRLFERSAIFATFADLGYRLVDTWSNPELGCRIPFHATHSIASYTGFYLTLA